MNEMKKGLQLHEFIVLKIPYAIHLNPTCEYSEEEKEGARRVLESDINNFKKEEREFILQAFACLIKSIEANKMYLNFWDEKAFKNKGESWKQYHKMIPEFNRVLQSFYYKNFEGELEHEGKIFPIKKITFEGSKAKDKIILSGPILTIIEAMFDSFNRTMWDSQKKAMKDFSSQLYEAYQEFMLQWEILFSESGTNAKQLVKNREEDKKTKALNTYKYSIAYNIHLSLNSLVVQKAKAKYPSLNKRIIGKLLNEVNLFDYFGYTSDKDIENFIKRGSPETLDNTTRTQKP